MYNAKYSQRYFKFIEITHTHPHPDFSGMPLCVTGMSRDKINAGAQHVAPLLSDFEE
jgi:hypothetical protein